MLCPDAERAIPFHEIVGRRRVITRISQAIARDSLPSSVLLTGPGGVGRRLLADAIAQALSSGAPRGDASGLAVDACGSRSACRRIVRGTCPVVLVLAPGEGGSITVDQVRVAI